jgi:glucoamylase
MKTLDISSDYGLLLLNNYDEEKVNSSFLAAQTKLSDPLPAKGMPRFESDEYFLSKKQYTGNPWIVCTLWMAQFYIRNGQTDKAQMLVEWAMEHTSHSGMMSEQIDPQTGEALGVSPLVWSHAAFVDTVLLLSEIN